MIDINDLRERPEAYIQACAAKRIKFDVPGFLALDAEYRGVKADVEKLRTEQNANSKLLPTLKGEEKTKALEQLKGLAAQVKAEEQRLREVEGRWRELLLWVPSIPREDVPHGANDTENVEIKRVGKIPEFGFKPKDHVELSGLHQLFDIERGVKIAGARSYVLTGWGVRLHHAVLALALDMLHAKGYLLMDPPHLVSYEAMLGTGYLPAGEDSAYRLDERDPKTYLIGTSEVPVAAYHMDEILSEDELPKRYAGYSPCYRREAGTYGKDTQGLYRVHQFYKVEQVAICRADRAESDKLHAELLGNAEELLQALELPYRVVAVCTGDLGQGQVYKNDIEAWMPSRSGWGETHSCSSFSDFQARRLRLRYRSARGDNVPCYTLNNTLIASPRILIPLLEVHQQEDGSILIPQSLRSYLGGASVIA